MAKSDDEVEKVVRSGTKAAAAATGTVAGGSAGAAAGTMVSPGVGTAVGYLAGSAVGGASTVKAVDSFLD